MKQLIKTVTRVLMVIIILELIFLPLSAAKAQQGGGIAVSGSFYRHHFKLVPGESFSSPDVDIVIFNNYAVEIQVALSAETPQGVTLDLAGQTLSIPPNSNVSLPVKMTVDGTVVPGEYNIGLSADVIPGNKEGIAIAGSAQLRTILTVFGEAGLVKVNLVTQEGAPFVADLKIFQVSENNLEPSAYVFGDILEDRLVPGDYVVTAYFEGTEVASQKFTVAAQDDKKIELKVNTAFVIGLTAVPQFNDSNNRITSARINYTVKAVFQPIKNVTVYLNVKKGGKDVEKVEMYTLPELALGSQDSRYTYIPSDGWSSGEYSFTVEIVSNDSVQQAISEAYLFPVPMSATGEVSWGLYILIGIIVLVAAVVLYFQFIKRK